MWSLCPATSESLKLKIKTCMYSSNLKMCNSMLFKKSGNHVFFFKFSNTHVSKDVFSADTSEISEVVSPGFG